MDKDRIESISKIVTAAGAIIGGIAIPLIINYNMEKNRQSQMYVQIMSQREQSDSSLREKMFNALITSYFGKNVAQDPEKQMMYLNLLSLNFQEFFDAKPLFEDLENRLNGEKKEKLQKIAREIADRQVNLLTKPEKRPMEMNLCVKDLKDCHNGERFEVEGKGKNSYIFRINLIETGHSKIRVRVTPFVYKPSAHQSQYIADSDLKTLNFDVSYYDMPFMRNTRLIDGTRFSVILMNVDNKGKQASIRIITFPEEYMSLRDRPYFEEMLKKIQANK